MIAEETPVVRVSRQLAASPERVFRAWIDPALVALWLSPVGHAVAEIDPRPGGRLQVTMVGDGRRIDHTGEYREVVPDRRLVFTWLSPYTGPLPSIVTVEVEPRNGGTWLTLTHEQLPGDAVESHGGGWTRMLARLADMLADGRESR
jgi:uncharacterized protein YndB with AHSA1/START domain